MNLKYLIISRQTSGERQCPSHPLRVSDREKGCRLGEEEEAEEPVMSDADAKKKTDEDSKGLFIT